MQLFAPILGHKLSVRRTELSGQIPPPRLATSSVHNVVRHVGVSFEILALDDAVHLDDQSPSYTGLADWGREFP